MRGTHRPQRAARRGHRRHLRPRPGAGAAAQRNRARASPLSPARQAASKQTAEDNRRPRHCRRRRAEGRHLPDRAADYRQPRRPRRADQQCVEPRPGAAGAACRHRMRSAGGGAGGQSRRRVPPDQGAVRRACRFRARRARRAGDQHFQRRGRQRLSRLGRLWRQQGGASPFDGDLGRGSQGRRRTIPRDRSRRHGYAAACARRS